MRPRRPHLLPLSGLALLAVGIALAHEGHEALPMRGSKVEPGGIVRLTSEARTSIGLKVAPVEEQTFEETFVANGKVIAPWDARTFATARVGGRVVSVAVKAWDTIKAGDVLATIESTELEDLGLALIQARLRQAFYEEVLTRETGLVKKGISPGKELIEIETELAKAKSAEETTRGKLLSVGIERTEVERRAVERTPARVLAVRAPRSGIIHHLDVTVGELVEPTKHLFEIVDLSTVWIETRVLEPDVRRVRLGADAKVLTTSGSFRGRVVHIAQVADEQDRCVPVYVEVPNSSGVLKGNQPARVEIVVSRTADAVAVPQTAVISLGVERFVLVEEEPGVYKRKDLLLGTTNEGFVEALEGLYLGDHVVMAGQHELETFFATGELQVSAQARKRLRVTDDEVDLGPLGEVAHVVGHVRLPTGHEATATARAHGKVARLVARPGMAVKEGDVLAEVESLELESMEFDLIQADLELSLAKTNLARLRALGEIQARAELLRVENEVGRQEATVASFVRKLHLLGVGDAEIAKIRERREPIRPLLVRSPIAGVVSPPLVIAGQVVSAGSPIFRVLDASTLWIEGAALAGDVARVASGQSVRVRLPALPDEVFAGRVAFVGQVLDESSRSLPVYVTVPNQEGRLRPGLQATVDVVLGTTREVISTPLASVLTESGSRVVILLDGATFRRIPVELGPRRDDTRVEVLRGLFPGDRVVTTGAEEVRSALLSLR